MTTKDDGGPVYPGPVNPNTSLHPGISLRDYFAGQAILAFGPAISHALQTSPVSHSAGIMMKISAIESYALADAMLEARKR